MRRQMECGELSAEPENERGKPGQEDRQLISGRRRADAAPSIKPRAYTDGIAGDDFFGDDDEEDSQQSEASDS